MSKVLNSRQLILAVAVLSAAIDFFARFATLVGAPLPFDRDGIPVMPDLANRLTAARLVLSGRASRLYDLAIQRTELAIMLPPPHSTGNVPPHPYFEPFVAPPLDVILYAPLAGLPYIVAAAIWLGLTLLMLGIVARLLWPLVPGVHRDGFALWGILFGLSMPVFALLNNGQDTALSLLLLVVGFRLLRSRHDASAGAVLALGLFKPQIVALVPLYFLARRNWAALGGWMVTAAMLIVLSVAIVGVGGALAYARLLASGQMAGIVTELGWQMATIPSMLRLLWPGIGAIVVILVDGLVLGLYLHRVGRLDRDEAFALTIVVTVLLTPYLFLYDFGILLLPVAILLARRPRPPVTSWIVGVGYALLSTAVLRHVAFGGDPLPWSLLGAPWAVVALLVLGATLGWGSIGVDESVDGWNGPGRNPRVSPWPIPSIPGPLAHRLGDVHSADPLEVGG